MIIESTTFDYLRV